MLVLVELCWAGPQACSHGIKLKEESTLNKGNTLMQQEPSQGLQSKQCPKNDKSPPLGGSSNVKTVIIEKSQFHHVELLK